MRTMREARKRLPKLGKIARWVLTIGIILIPVVVLAIIYTQNSAEESQLRTDLAAAPAQLSSRLHIWQQRLADRSQKQAQLQDDINGTGAEVEQTQSQLWDNINETVDHLSQVDLVLAGVISGLDDIIEQVEQVISPQLALVIQEQFPHQYTESIEIGDELFQAADDANVTISDYTCSLPSGRTVNDVTYQVFSIDLSIQGQVPDLLDFNIKVSQRFSDCDFKSVSINMPEEEGGVASMTFVLEIYCYG